MESVGRVNNPGTRGTLLNIVGTLASPPYEKPLKRVLRGVQPTRMTGHKSAVAEEHAFDALY